MSFAGVSGIGGHGVVREAGSGIRGADAVDAQPLAISRQLTAILNAIGFTDDLGVFAALDRAQLGENVLVAGIDALDPGRIDAELGHAILELGTLGRIKPPAVDRPAGRERERQRDTSGDQLNRHYMAAGDLPGAHLNSRTAIR